MVSMDRLNGLFVGTAFFIQLVLVAFFALRKWRFDAAMQWGWAVYALAVPAVLVSVVLLIDGRSWFLWLAGFLYAAWAFFGYVVDIAHPTAWRSPIVWSVLIPYVLLYLAAQMFYWWPLAAIYRPLWFAYGALFMASTLLNLTSHA